MCFLFLGLAMTPSILTSQYGHLPHDDLAITKKLKDPNQPEVAVVETIIDTTHSPHPDIELKSGAGLINADKIEEAFDHPKLVKFVGEIKGKERPPPKRTLNNAPTTGSKRLKVNKMKGAGIKYA